MLDRPLQPPKGFRKPIPEAVTIQAVMRQRFLCAACDEPLALTKGLKLVVHRDHRPALTARGWDPVARDTIPPANDPDFIEILHLHCHGLRTAQDIKVRAKTIRRQKKADAHERAMAEKVPGRPRPRSGKIRSRNTLRRRENAKGPRVHRDS